MNPLLEKLLAALGLPATTAEDAALAAVTTLHAEKAKSLTALQAALDPIAVALGLQAGIDAGAVLTGAQALATGKGGKDSEQALTALQSELATVTKSLNSLQETTKREKAEAYVDGAIKAGRVGVKPLRDRYIAMHMADPAGTAELIAGLPVLGGGGEIVPPPAPAGEIALQAEQRQAARLLGIAEKDYLATLKAERQA